MIRLFAYALLIILTVPLVMSYDATTQEIIDSQKESAQSISSELNQTREILNKQVEEMKNQTLQIKAQMEQQKKMIEAQRSLLINQSLSQVQAQKLMEQQKQKAVAQKLRSDLEHQMKEINETLSSMKKEQQETYTHQMKMILAVNAIISAQNELSDMPQNISTMAYQINSSIENTTKAEEDIRSRNALVKAFMGGDAHAAEEIESVATQNQQKIKQINASIEASNYSVDIKSLLSGQIDVLQTEQERLINLSSAEKENKGVIGWIWK